VLAAAYDLQESFNYLSLTLTRNTLPADVLNNVDVLLEPYGGVEVAFLGEEFILSSPDKIICTITK